MKTITRKEYQEYLKEQRQGTTSTLISQEMREFIKANESDINKAFIGTNITVISFPTQTVNHQLVRILRAQEYLQEIKDLVENPEITITSDFDLDSLSKAKEYIKAFIQKQNKK